MHKTLFLSLTLLLLTSCAHPLQRGRDALEDEDYERAREIAEEAIDDKEDGPRAHLLYAEELVAQGRFEEALPYARRAARGEAEGADGLCLYGDLLGKLRREL